jgi:hypothetical protein
MKAAIIAGCALLLATGTAHAETWDFNNYKRCTATMVLKVSGEQADAPSIEISGVGARGGPGWSVLDEPFPLTVSREDTATVIFKRKHLAKLKTAVRFLEKCRSWVWDHNKQKAIYATPRMQKELDNED